MTRKQHLLELLYMWIGSCAALLVALQFSNTAIPLGHFFIYASFGALAGYGFRAMALAALR